jgi:2-polyprenyl-6-methoxyphenol hydroxylase-like FAD-dependent oxidoreductase
VGTKQIQRLLLKACLLLGVEVSYSVDFLGVEEVGNGKWKIKSSTTGTPVNFEFNTLIGADGEHSQVNRNYQVHTSPSFFLCLN